jgi:hypothetical protein
MKSDGRTISGIVFNIILIILTFFLSIIIFTYSKAQTDLGTSFITGKPGATIISRDYEAIGVNPANLGLDDNNRFSLGIGAVNFNLQAKGIKFKDLISSFSDKNNTNNNNNEIINYSNNDNKNSIKISSPQVTQILNLINNEGINMNTGVTLAGMSLHLGRLGGIGISLRDRVIMHFSNNNLTEPNLDSLLNAKNAPPASWVINGTKANIEYLRELNVAYGVKLPHLLPLLDIYAGFGYRYIAGLGYVNLKSFNNSTILQTSINSSNYAENITDLLHVPLKSADIFNADGRGSAIDIAANAVLLKKIKFGIAVVNIGSVKWNSVQQANLTNAGIDTLQKHVNTLKDLFNQESLFKNLPGFTTQLPAECRIGAGIKLTRFLEVGADIAKPLNNPYGYYSQTIMSAGLQLNLFKMFIVNTGISGNRNIGWNLPVGITISTHGFYDIYFATNDILTYVNKTKNPMFSFAVCAVRLNLPARKIRPLRIISVK